MIIKTFTAQTETEALELARKELGPTAIVTKKKENIPHGLMALFKKPSYEITAAVDDAPVKPELSRKEAARNLFMNNPNIIFEDNNEKDKKDEQEIFKADKINFNDTASIEKQLSNLTTMIEKTISRKDEAKEASQPHKKEEPGQEDNKNDRNVSCIRLIYNQLVENEVDEKYVNQVISEIEPTLKKDAPVENILAAIYQKIVLKLGKAEAIDISGNKCKYIFFIGPTGVGKTTTIAKIASKLKLEKKLNIALLTADTYRIAAVEQLHSYANILQVPLTVVYNETEIAQAREDLKNFDIVLIDTAGRSHRDKEQTDDIERLIKAIPEEDREVYLVLSVTTKYKDLISITEAYSEISDYRLIFTKLDESACVGNIFNIRLLTGCPLSYATFGQKVPNDISRIDAQTIAKQLLGGAN